MPIYHQLGQVPKKRHTVFKQPESDEIYYEELMGNKGFVGLSSLLYHRYRPTAIKQVQLMQRIELKAEEDPRLRMRHFRLARMNKGGSVTLNRTPVLFNEDVVISFCQPDVTDDFYYRNGQADELIYVSDGEGMLDSVFGELPFRRGDYLVIPRGILYRLSWRGKENRTFIVESPGAIETPKRYRNEHGQLLEGAPYSERDVRRPQRLISLDEKTKSVDTKVLVKAGNCLNEVTLSHHPCNVVGWDGYYYPWALNIEDFEPIVGMIHQPPPVHQTFQAHNFVVCSFVPRLYDFHPQAIPAPYHHSNVMSDEVIYYAKDNFMSRKGIEYASLTLHPDGLPHGPHPGRAEASIGQTSTDELAVMVDTFRPLKVAQPSLAVEDTDYVQSWL